MKANTDGTNLLKQSTYVSTQRDCTARITANNNNVTLSQSKVNSLQLTSNLKLLHPISQNNKCVWISSSINVPSMAQTRLQQTPWTEYIKYTQDYTSLTNARHNDNILQLSVFNQQKCHAVWHSKCRTHYNVDKVTKQRSTKLNILMYILHTNIYSKLPVLA